MSGGPELRLYMNTMALNSFPASSSFPVPHGSFQQRMEVLAAAGFDGVQFSERAAPGELASCRALGLGVAASIRVNHALEADGLAEQVDGDGYECATVHAGWGMEDDAEADRLIEGILKASARRRIPLYVETHRATVCQDMWRTVQLVDRFPELRFNADFSHWYAGQEMIYGGFEKKLSYIQPVLERVRFMHGRVASPGCIQVAIDEAAADEPIYVEHFRQLWRASFRGFLAAAGRESLTYITFAPELLAPEIFYARTFRGVEESDRWEQSLILAKMARECFTCANSI